MTADEKYMREAIKQAKKAYAIGEVPIGCVIVYQDKIIARGYNRRTIDKNTLANALLLYILITILDNKTQVKQWTTGSWKNV